MDKLKLNSEIDSMKQLREHYQTQLKTMGLDMAVLPEDVSAMLNECAELQLKTNVSHLHENLLEELYFTKKKEQIDNDYIIAKLEMEIDNLEKQIQDNTTEIEDLEKFVKNTSSRTISEAKMFSEKSMLESQIKRLEEKKSSLIVPEDLAIMDMIAKIEMLKHNQQTSKHNK